ncbi:MAG: 23S rRNA (pseudouridine(1915)-N(3))-methyltransferase RlmH [Algiphilus sp.]|uniref:23S rRNA (pseudouridine(1915)-N(3))-methyltransferase RlmH n=1 Tax=Algiphilus sp. TaxID=1872431 RepID=UPI0032EF6A61
MRIRVIAVGTRLPAWADTAVEDFTRRMPHECQVEVQAVAAEQRSKKPDTARIMRNEATRIRAKMLPGSRVVVLDERGKPWTTRQWAQALEGWMGEGQDVSMLIGGADGLEPALRASGDPSVALSPLTLPHALARVLLVEALYRAWSLSSGHPYHRE